MKVLHPTLLILLILVFSIAVFGQEKTELKSDKQVLINVTVVNKDDELLSDLSAQDFRLYENKKPVEISHFKYETSPMSVGFLIDVSPSISEYIDLSREAILAFLERNKLQNEYFVAAFARKADVLSEFSGAEQTAKVISESPYFTKNHGGQTALYDAMVLGIERLAKSKNHKRILLIFGDGTDNKSSIKFQEIERLIRERNIVVYIVGFNNSISGMGGMFKLESYSKMVKLSGGKMLLPSQPLNKSRKAFYRSEIISLYDIFIHRVAAFADQLQSQYVIGFEPDLEDVDTIWRNLEVKLENIKELRKKNGEIFILHRGGYYPNSEIVTDK